MNRQAVQATRRNDVQLGPPRQLQLSLLKWSYVDLDLEGLHEFSGTVHFVGANRLRNDTGLNFTEATYYDGSANTTYAIPAFSAGQEVSLDTIPHKPIVRETQQVWNPNLDQSSATLDQLMRAGFLPLAGEQRVFEGFTDGPSLPVQLNVPHQEKVRALIVVALEQP